MPTNKNDSGYYYLNQNSDPTLFYQATLILDFYSDDTADSNTLYKDLTSKEKPKLDDKFTTG